MKRILMSIAAVAALAAGMASAQAPAGPQQPAPGKSAMKPGTILRRRMGQALNLTAAQKQQAKSIFQQARVNAQPVAQQLKENREALATAVKANDSAQIQSLSAQQGNLRGQILAIRSDAMAKFYAILTADQRAKAEQLQQRIRQRIQKRLGDKG